MPGSEWGAVGSGWGCPALIADEVTGHLGSSLTIQAGGHGPQGVGAFLHVHQQLFPWPNVLDDFIVNLGRRKQRERVSVSVTVPGSLERRGEGTRPSPSGAACWAGVGLPSESPREAPLGNSAEYAQKSHSPF